MKQFRGVTLRQVVRSDFPMLFGLLSDPDRFHLWGHRRVLDEVQFPETWRYWSAERMGSKFIIVKHGRPIGLVFDYERSMEDGHTKLATMLVDEETGRGAGIIATGLFGQWLFQSLPLRKLYLDVFGFNTPVLRMLKRVGVRQETQRVEHRFWNGKYWDSYGFVILRDELAGVLQRIFHGRNLSPAPRPLAGTPIRVPDRNVPQTQARTRVARCNGRYDVLDHALVSVARRA